MSREHLLRALADLGAAKPPQGAFWADDPGMAWIVEQGAVDVFIQRREKSGAPAGARHHVYRATRGRILFGVDAGPVRAAHGLIAVPLPDARVLAVPLARLQQAAGDPACAEDIVELANDWVVATARGMRKDLPPRNYLTIAPGREFEASEGQVLSPNARLVWIEVSEGNALWMERYDCPINQGTGPVPVPNDVWLKAADHVAARGLEAVEVLEGGRLWTGLEQHQCCVLRFLMSAADQAMAAEAQRLEAKATRSLVLTREALQRLLAVAEGTREARGPTREDSLLGACELVGRRMGIEFRLPPVAERAALARDPVGTMATAARVRHRQVALKEEWWKTDNGPLLASYADKGNWVALLPAAGGYELHDPTAGTVERVTGEVTEKIAPFATMFYRPFPDREISPLDIMRFGVFGLGRDVAMVIAMGLLAGALGMLMPIASGTLIDTLIPSADAAGVWQMVAALLAAAAAGACFDVVRAIAVLRIEGKMDGAVQAAVWDRVLKLPVPFFRDYTAGDLAVRINGVNVIRHALSGSTMSTLLTSVFSIFNFFLLFYYSPWLATVATLLVAIAIALTLSIGWLKLRYERRLSEAAGRLSGVVFQYLTGIAKLRVASAEGRAFANWARIFTEYRQYSFRAQHLENVQSTIFAGYSPVVTAVIFAAVGAVLIERQAAGFSTGDFIAFNAAFGAFFAGMLSASGTLLDLLNLVPVYERAKPVLKTLPEADESKAHPNELQGGIEVVKLCFGYGDGPPILDDVSFSVRPGGFIALVGPSGSGKSTLFRLLLGFEKPRAGSIYYDNQDLADLDVLALRRQLGVVLQNSQLMTGDIFTNIVGASHLTLDDAWEAARMVGLDEDIEQMPMGMHTVISEGASTLSGGQRQRILIARAIVHRPRIIFFDEATSALDNRTQAVVTRSLDQIKATRIVIAHRLSTVINADRILVLQDGRIVQNGNYETLLKQDGPFRALAKRQIV